jgi:molecular chaperone HscB
MSSPPSPFSVLGLPPGFDLTPDQIHAAHLARVSALHPDLLPPGLSEDDASRLAAELNDAKQVLGNPESRANALLLFLGGPTKELDRSLPPGFLMEMMDTRQEIESALASKGEPTIARWIAWANDQRREHEAVVSQLFKALATPPDPRALAAIRTRLNAWRYIERLIEQLEPGHHHPKRPID